MPPAKYTKSGQTVKLVRATILLHPDLHARAKRAANGHGLSEYVSSLVSRETGWKQPVAAAK